MSRALAIASLSATMLVASTAWGLGAQTPIPVKNDVKEALKEDSAFCDDPDYPLEEAARDYCPLIDNPSEVCPRFRDACAKQNYPQTAPNGRAAGRPIGNGSSQGDDKLGRSVRRDTRSNDPKGGTGSGNPSESGNGHDKNGNGNGDGTGASNGDGTSRSGTEPPKKDDPKQEPKKPPDPPDPPKKVEIPGIVAVLFKILFFAVVAAVIAYVIFLIVKNIQKNRSKKGDEEDAPTEVPAEATAVVPRGPIETDVDRLLNRARAAAERGDYKQAIDDTYAALLRRLEGDGVIDLHPSRTNGDYVRSIRDKADLRRAVRSVADDVERMQFGTEAPNPNLFQSVWNKVLPLVGRTAVVLAILLGLGSAQVGCDASPSLAAGKAGSQTGKGPMGRAALESLVEKQNIHVVHRRGSSAPDLDKERAILITPDVELDKATWKKLIAFARQDGGKVVIVGHRDFLSDDLDVDFEIANASTDVTPSLEGPALLFGYRLSVPPGGALNLGKTTHMTRLLERGTDVYAVQRAFPGGGRVVVFADDGLFANVALAVGDNAAWLVEMFRSLGTAELEVWDASSSSGAGSPFESVANAHLTAVVLQLMALVLLYLFYKGPRFGTPVELKRQSRRAFADHARALGATYARAKASRHAAGLYSLWALDRLRERLQRGGRRGLIPMAEQIAARTGRNAGDVTRVLVEATGARDEIAPPSSFRSQDVGSLGSGGMPTDEFAIMRELDVYLAATQAKTTVRTPTR